MNIWAVANQKGGVGKTTTAVTLAGLLAQSGHKTLLIDLDPQGSLTSYLGVDPETVNNSVYDLFEHAAEARNIDVSTVIVDTDFELLSLMPASTAMATLEKRLGARNGMGLVMKTSLAQLTDEFEYVLIDCPPMLGMLMVSALVASDRLIIPVQTEHLAIKGSQRMVRTLEMVGHSLKKKINFKVLPTMFDQRTTASVKSLQRIINEYGEDVVASAIPVDTKFRDASYKGKPLSIMSPHSRGVMAYEELLYSMDESLGAMPLAVAQ